MGRLPSRLPVYPFGDNEKLQFGSGADYAIYYDGTDFLIDSGTHSLEIDLATAGRTNIYGGDTANDSLYLYGSSTTGTPYIRIHDNASLYLALGAAKTLIITDSGTTFSTISKAVFAMKTGAVTGAAFNFYWDTKTTTGNIIGVDIDASTSLTMGTNFGATGLKINVAAPNGSGKSQGIDLSSLAVDFPVFKVVSDAGNTAGALTGQIAIDVAGTTYYLYYYTTSTVT